MATTIERPTPAGSKPYGMSACKVTFARPADAPIRPSTARGTYDGAELLHSARPGGDAHRAHPSLIGSERVYLCGKREAVA